METEMIFTYREKFDTLNAAVDFIRAYVPDGDLPFTAYISRDQLLQGDDGKNLRVTVTIKGQIVGPFQFVAGTQ